MNLYCIPKISSVSTSHPFINEATNSKSPPLPKRVNSVELRTEFLSTDSLGPTKLCSCGRRHFIEAAIIGTTLFPIQPSKATNSHFDYTNLVNKFHPPRPDWYEEFYASVMNSATKSYEAEVARYKSQIFSGLKGKALKILEVGIGTGPNLSYYAGNSDVQVVGIDPNPKMEKYARLSAVSAGLPLTNFEFIQAVSMSPWPVYRPCFRMGRGIMPQKKFRSNDNHLLPKTKPLVSRICFQCLWRLGLILDPSCLFNFAFVGEAIPLSDASVDAVVGTLVLCSVRDVDMTLKGNETEVRRVLRPGGQYVFVEHVAAKDGTFLKFIQGVLDPLQQTVADGCHLSRETGNNISRAGFSSVELNMAFLSNATFINPHAYGIGYK
ncbi:putative S-adenosyl-L-methionine-dependent methyltransferase [Lupinus albus]|uniref:Putative S-adenosyl-L-methionine-dependent methyltransferase n=1 Tax=Lupinus albus TaxID=3870 RepID=A0A6A4QPN6_LUPAL|nr:putative S-adenosyl-L-methionine-dependent methyltransferase [Lupinus albus]